MVEEECRVKGRGAVSAGMGPQSGLAPRVIGEAADIELENQSRTLRLGP